MREDSFTIGIGLNLFDARGILLKDDGKIVAEVKRERVNTNANETLTTLLELYEDILSKSKRYKDNIAGIGLALGGIVSHKKGIVHWPQRPDSYISLPLGDYLEKRFGFPVSIENDATACAWAEYATSYAKCKYFLYMFSGVGCGIIADGKLYRGNDGGAGELFLNTHKTMSSSLGDFSFLKHWPADLGMVQRAKEYISLGRETSLIKKVTSLGDLSLDHIFDEAKKRDKVAREVIKEACCTLGAKVSFLINLLNPDAVVIGGGLEKGGEFLLEECMSSIKRFAFIEMRKNCKVTLSQLGPDATSLGAALLAREEKALQR